MAALAGTLRSEAMPTSRAAHVVRFRGSGHGDRIITARPDEYEYGLALLNLCRRMRPAEKTMLQAVCTDARAPLRAGRTFEDILDIVRVRGLLLDDVETVAEASEAPAAPK